MQRIARYCHYLQEDATRSVTQIDKQLYTGYLRWCVAKTNQFSPLKSLNCMQESNSLQPHESQHTRPPCPGKLLEFTQTHVHWIGDTIQLSHPLSSSSPPIFNISQHQGLFQWVRTSHQVAKALEFSSNISPSNEYSGLISFSLDLLVAQGTFKYLL